MNTARDLRILDVVTLALEAVFAVAAGFFIGATLLF